MPDAEIVVFQHEGLRLTQADHEVILKSFVSPDATPEEIRVFYYDCARRGVNPMDRLIHFSKRGGKYVPVVGIDYMRQRAEASETYAGSDDAVFEEGAGKYPEAATVAVWKRFPDGQRFPFTATARWQEYCPTPIDGAAAFMWRKMPHTMLAKCAEALALRKAFPGQLAGLYEKSEMDQAEVLTPKARAEMGAETLFGKSDPKPVEQIETITTPDPGRPDRSVVVGTVPIGDPAPRNWPAELVEQAKVRLIAANVVPSNVANKHLIMLLNLTPFGPDMSVDDLATWGGFYRTYREMGSTTKDAAKAATSDYFGGETLDKS